VVIRRFEDIEGWKQARRLTVSIYAVSKDGPFRSDFGMRDQIRRAAVSVMANIAEGFGRRGNREFSRYLTVAQASVVEVQSHLYVALDLCYVEQAKFDCLFQQARRVEDLIGGLIRYLGAPATRTTNERRRTTNA
jgi:four helix bundle protein